MNKEDQILELLGRLCTDVTDLKEGQKRVETRLDRVETRLDRVETRLDRVETRMDDLATRMDGLETRMDHLETRMDGFETRLDRVETRMDDFAVRMDSLETRMDDFAVRMDGLETRMDHLETESRQTRVLLENQEHNTRLIAEQYMDVAQKLGKANERAGQVDDLRDRVDALEVVTREHSAKLRELARAE